MTLPDALLIAVLLLYVVAPLLAARKGRWRCCPNTYRLGHDRLGSGQMVKLGLYAKRTR